MSPTTSVTIAVAAAMRTLDFDTIDCTFRGAFGWPRPRWAYC